MNLPILEVLNADGELLLLAVYQAFPGSKNT